MTGGEIVTFKQGASLVATAAQGVIKVYRANRTVNKHELQQLRTASERSVALARINAVGDLARANIQELADTARLIDSLPSGSVALPFAMDQLEHLNRSLRRIIDAF